MLGFGARMLSPWFSEVYFAGAGVIDITWLDFAG